MRLSVTFRSSGVRRTRGCDTGSDKRDACRNEAGGKTVTVDPANPSKSDVVPDTGEPWAALCDQGLERLCAGDRAHAIDLLRYAAAQNPDDPGAQLGLGIALQGMRRHAEALEPLERAQKLSPQGPLALLHASVSLLALDRAEAALRAAEEACARASEQAQAHSARGQALLALNDPARAEEAFAEALRRAPQSADVWVLCGAARYRQGAIEGVRDAMREALRHAPDHAGAKAALAALERIGDAGDAAASVTPNACTIPACARPEVKDELDSAYGGRKIRRPRRASRSSFSARSRPSPDFNSANGHKSSSIRSPGDTISSPSIGTGGSKDFSGWALTSAALAEQWVEGRAGLKSEQCREGDCVIVNAFAAETHGAKRFIINTMRGLFADKHTLYFKRHYRDGRTRPMRLGVNDFVADHLAQIPGTLRASAD